MTVNGYLTNQPPSNITDVYVSRVGIGTIPISDPFQVGSASSTFVITGIGSVGIGTTTPQSKLHVIGNVIISGVTTVTDLVVQQLNVSGISTTNSLNIGATQVLSSARQLQNIVSLDTTTATTIANAVQTNNFNSLNIGATQVLSSARQLQNITSLDATTIATIEGSIQNSPNTFTDLQVTGISTFTNGPVLIGSGTITGTEVLRVSGNVRSTGIFTDSSGNLRSIPQNSQTSSYTLVASDNGKHISITTGGVTIPANVFSVGDTIAIYNNSGSNQTLTQGPGVTLRLSGTSNTGNRTLSQYGLATVLCVDSNTFVLTGSGLS